MSELDILVNPRMRSGRQVVAYSNMVVVNLQVLDRFRLISEPGHLLHTSSVKLEFHTAYLRSCMSVYMNNIDTRIRGFYLGLYSFAVCSMNYEYIPTQPRSTLL